MNRILPLIYFTLPLIVGCGNNNPLSKYMTDSVEETDGVPRFAKCIIETYPDFSIEYSNNTLVFNGDVVLKYDDSTSKTVIEKMDNADIEDMSYWPYLDTVEKFNDAGRIRCDAFFMTMYGSSFSEVSKNLKTITWCPNIVNAKIQVTTINGVDKQLKKVSDELDKHPEWKPYLQNVSTVNWRYISGTKRRSSHSYGIAIDIGVPMSDYWKWKNPKASETDEITYHNRFPRELIKIFEKYGFIWGGNWYHYDTMHFEYRPEILIYNNRTIL